MINVDSPLCSLSLICFHIPIPLAAVDSDKINETEEIDHTRRYPTAAQCILCCSLRRSLITQKYPLVCALRSCKLSGRSQCPRLPSCTWHTSSPPTHSHG